MLWLKMEENKNNKNGKLIIIGIIVVLVLVGGYFLISNLSVPKSPSSWCVSGDSWKNPINGEEMITRNIIYIGEDSVCLAYSSLGGKTYAFSQDDVVIYRQDYWNNFTRIK